MRSGAAPLAGRTAIVTGAASGIGAATARHLAAAGARVVISHHPEHEQDAPQVRQAILQAGGECAVIAADVADAEQVQALLSASQDRFAAPDVVIANAGVAPRAASEDVDAAAMRAVLDVDLVGVHELFRGAVTTMRDAGHGRLLATSSTSGPLYGWNQHAAYCAAKAGVVGLVRAYAAEYGPDGVTANAVLPGVVRTRQSLDARNSLGESGLKAVAAATPLRRVGTPDDVAAVFTFLATDAAAYVTGQGIVVDGGLSIVEPE